jgi:hypothetical protein
MRYKKYSLVTFSVNIYEAMMYKLRNKKILYTLVCPRLIQNRKWGGCRESG